MSYDEWDEMDDKDDECNEEDDCTKTIEKNVRIQALVTVEPKVFLDEPDVDCCKPVKVSSNKKNGRSKQDKYKFFVEQELCLKIPLTFHAQVEAKPLGIICHPDEKCDECSSGSGHSSLFINRRSGVTASKVKDKRK